MLRRNYVAADVSELILTASAPVSTSLSDENSAAQTESNADPQFIQKELSLVEADPLDALTINVPLPKNTYFEDISFENHYPEHTLAIRINFANPAFFNNCEVTASTGLMHSCLYRYDEISKSVTLLLTTNKMYEFTPRFSSDLSASPYVSIICHSLQTLYDNIIVIDPVPNTSQDATDASLQLARAIQTQAQKADNGTRIILTRTDQRVLNSETILQLVRDSSASKYISLILPEGAVNLRASAYFNDRFFIRDYGNLQLATDVEQALSALDGITLTGIYASNTSDDTTVSATSETQVLTNLKIPGAMLRIDGLRTASREDLMLIDQTAAALLNAIQ